MNLELVAESTATSLEASSPQVPSTEDKQSIYPNLALRSDPQGSAAMFERYTEKARRVIFFARYEASNHGNPFIEPEHLLLALIREDKTLADQFALPSANLALLHEKLRGNMTVQPKTKTPIDLPLNHECRRVLSLAADEAEQRNSHHIGPTHMLLGLLRAEECTANKLLRQFGFTIDAFRGEAQSQETPRPLQNPLPGLDRWLATCKAMPGVSVVMGQGGTDNNPYGAIYDGIGTLSFRKVDMNNTDGDKIPYEQKPRLPLLCVDVIHHERFFELLKRYDTYIAAGFGEIWTFLPELKRTYTVTKAYGLRECKERVLKLAHPALEMNVAAVFV